MPEKKNTGNSRIGDRLIKALNSIGLRWPPIKKAKKPLLIQDQDVNSSRSTLLSRQQSDELGIDAQRVDDDQEELDTTPTPLSSERKSLKRTGRDFSFTGLVADASFYKASFTDMLRQPATSQENQALAPSILEDVDAVDQSGAPQEVAKKIAEACNEYGIAITIRSSFIGSDTPQRYYEGLFTAKNTNIHTKSTKTYCPTRGHISKSPDHFEPGKGKDLYDHQETEFPEEATELTVDDMIKLSRAIKKPIPKNIISSEDLKNIFISNYGAYHHEGLLDHTHDEKITDMRMFNGRLCFKIERDSYRFAVPGEEITDEIKKRFDRGEKSFRIGAKIFVKSGDKIYIKTGKRQEDYYMQEVESLGSVLIGLAKGHYTNLEFDRITGKLTYRTKDPIRAYCINLNNLPHGNSERNIELLTTTIWTRDGSKRQQHIGDAWKSVEDQLSDTLRSELLPYIDEIMVGRDVAIPVYERRGAVEIPVLIVADPYPITNDLDLGHVAVPKKPTLPDIAYKIYDLFSVRGRRDLKRDAKLLLKDLASNPEKYSDKVRKLCELDEIDPKTGKSYLDLCFQERILGRMGGMSLAEFLYSCAINKAVDPTGKIQIIRHGAESKSPLMGQEKPEPFGAMLHIYDGMAIHTNDEQSCLNFYLFHDHYMRDKYIEVHPYWLRDRTADEPDLNGVWMDIIKYQALNGFTPLIKISYENMRYKYPAAYRKVQALLKEVEEIKKANLEQQASAEIISKYRNGFTGFTFREFNEFSILARPTAGPHINSGRRL